MTDKLTDIEIMEYVDGTLDPKEAERVEKILSTDEEAQQTANYMRASNNAMKQLIADDLSPTHAFEAEFKAKQASMETDSANFLEVRTRRHVVNARMERFLIRLREETFHSTWIK